MSTIEQNKNIVLRFNKEVIENGNFESFRELVSKDVCNHTAPPGVSNGADGMIYFLRDVLGKGFSDIKVEILEQIGERDFVTTRKRITGTHTGEIMNIPASHKSVEIHVIDIIRLRGGKYVDHWGMSNFAEVIAQISA